MTKIPTGDPISVRIVLDLNDALDTVISSSAKAARYLPWLGDRIRREEAKEFKLGWLKAIVEQEVEMLLEAKQSLSRRVRSAAKMDSLCRLEVQNLEESVVRRINMVAVVAEFAKLTGEQAQNAAVSQPRKPEMEDGDSGNEWIDLFWRTASRVMEPWRQRFMAKLLKAETDNADSIDLRTVREIGEIDRMTLSYLATWMDYAVSINGRLAIPRSDEEWMETECPVFDCATGSRVAVERISEICAVLASFGYIIPRQETFALDAGAAIEVRYPQMAYSVRINSDSFANADFTFYRLVSFGQKMEHWYSRKPRDEARELIRMWIAEQAARTLADNVTPAFVVEQLPLRASRPADEIRS